MTAVTLMHTANLDSGDPIRPTRNLKTGDTTDWVVLDGATLEPVRLCESRSECREEARHSEGRIGRIVLDH